MFSCINRSACVAAALLATTVSTPSIAFSERSSNAAQLSAAGSVMVIGGSMQTLAGVSQVVVGSVETAGEFIHVALEDTATSLSIVVRASATGGKAAALAVGDVLEVVASTAGHVLVSAGISVAYLPAAIADGLFRSSQRPE